jgi:hypothetical protein
MKALWLDPEEFSQVMIERQWCKDEKAQKLIMTEGFHCMHLTQT